jgi:RNA polymerase sigma factor (sigma-70 family)
MEDLDSRSFVSRGKNSLDIVDITLSDQEIEQHLGISGGREELSRILVQGALAKETMIKSNIRLVMSIAKKWLSGTSSSSNSDPSQSQSSKIVGGSWTTPSLDEVVQEGILGLAKAAERFEPDRNLKFSTYATYYITNEVRLCFQRATTGCLRVPPNFYQIRINYEKLVKSHYQKTGQHLDVQVAADKLGLKLKRLDFILRITKPLLQLDGPLPTGMGGSANGAGKAGANIGGFGTPLTFADSIEW